MNTPPVNTAAVEVLGTSWVVSYDTEPGDPEPVHYQHGTIHATGPVDFAVQVMLAGKWHDIEQVFAAPFIAALNADLNRIPSNE